jgi:predicted Ser/Thr protein kinase
MSDLSLLHFAHFEVRRREDGAPWELGRGAMGVTYKAYDPQLRLDIALKVINPAQVGDAKARALFLREARAAARVHHANVGNVVYLNQDPENMFYAMEFIAGESLRDWMHSRVPLSPLMPGARCAGFFVRSSQRWQHLPGTPIYLTEDSGS